MDCKVKLATRYLKTLISEEIQLREQDEDVREKSTDTILKSRRDDEDKTSKEDEGDASKKDKDAKSSPEEEKAAEEFMNKLTKKEQDTERKTGKLNKERLEDERKAFKKILRAYLGRLSSAKNKQDLVSAKKFASELITAYGNKRLAPKQNMSTYETGSEPEFEFGLKAVRKIMQNAYDHYKKKLAK